ncbi:MAG: methyltransferase domain-containing protein [Dehalococcoidia bacterium]|jgi:SAM-dependent methyltransferase|nr:methyltransferase domain-containing protein [Dehalococcoidia bacterium]
MASRVTPVVDTLRREVPDKYTEVATNPERTFHFHHGRPLAQLLGYPMDQVDAMPAGAVESFAGVGYPFSLGTIRPGETVLDLGSGGGFDCFVAGQSVGPAGRVIGVDMTEAMLARSRATAREMGLDQVEFRQRLVEELPVPDASADVLISNGVINLCPDKYRVFQGIFRALKPGGRLYLADIVVHKQVPDDAKANVDLWTA